MHPATSRNKLILRRTITSLRWLLLVSTIGGGFVGFVTALQAFSNLTSPTTYVLCVICVILYCYIVISGLLFADNTEAVLPLWLALGAQVPWLSTPFFAYNLSSGFHYTIGSLNGHLITVHRFGCDFVVSLFNNRGWGVGINVFAIVLMIALGVCSHFTITSLGHETSS
jgi:hypothetical protein